VRGPGLEIEVWQDPDYEFAESKSERLLLSPASLKRIRVVHALDGYDKREIARDYIR
jgi:hypothetical protein